MFGYNSRYLRINASNGAATWVPLAEAMVRRLLGGVGLAAYLMHRKSRAGLDPFTAEAPLILAAFRHD